MSVNSKMTAIADEIRELSGTTDTMGLDAMATHIEDANAEVDNQVELLAQAVAALEGKASGGEQAAPVISVSSNGLITATAGVKSSTHQLAFQAAKTITPSVSSQIAVSSGYYTGGNITVAAVPTQTKTVTPTSSAQNVTPDSGKFLSQVTVNGDSDLVAENIKSGVNIFGVTGIYEGSGGDTSAEDGLVARTLTSYTNDSITTIGNHAFYNCSSLTSVSFPEVTTIGSNAFYSCYSLTSVSFPVATTIGVGAFYNCSSLTSVSFPVATSISDHAFRGCSSLTSVSFPKVTTISNYAFYGCSSLTSVSFPKVTTISNYAFYNCSSLTSVSFPEVTTIGSSAFYGCSSLTSVSFPKVTFIGSGAFGYCRNLKSLYLTGSSLCNLSRSDAFTYTPIGGYTAYAGTYGSIYVPASLLTAYQTATNWTYFSSRFVGYDGGANLISFTIDETTCQAEEGMTWAEWLLSEYNTTGLEDPVIRDVNYNIVSHDTEIVAGESYSINDETLMAGLYDANDNLLADWDTLVNTYGLDVSLNYNDWTYKNTASSPYCVLNKIPDGVKFILPDGVTSIGQYAFYNCNKLTSVTLPNSVTSIGIAAFQNCSSLTSITIPDSVTSIGKDAFSGCSGLTSITIPDSVTSIGIRIFDKCTNLAEVTVDGGNTTYHSSGNCIIDTVNKVLIVGTNNSVIPSDGSVTSIGQYAFYDCSKLTSVTIPDGVTSIGQYAFYSCDKLTNITIPDSVTSIGDLAFSYCSGLTSVTIPDGVISIGQTAFKDCSGLTSITIPASVTSIGGFAFSGCSGLTSITIPNSVTSIGGSAFSGCSGLTSITIPNSVTVINGYTFSDCSGLTNITIPDSVTSIGSAAFQNCSSLTSITIPNKVTSIGQTAFSGCRGLTSITIPASVTSIGRSAFQYCTSLKSITFNDTSTWYRTTSSGTTSGGTKTTVSNASTNVTYFTSTYLNYYWYKN